MSYWQAYKKVLKVNSIFTLCVLGCLFVVGLVLGKIEDGKSPE